MGNPQPHLHVKNAPKSLEYKGENRYIAVMLQHVGNRQPCMRGFSGEDENMQMADFPADPRETIADIVVPTVAPRHDPVARRSDHLDLRVFHRAPLSRAADHLVTQLSRWAGPAALLATCLALGWWMIR